MPDYDAFVSYSSKDKSKMDQLLNELERKNFVCWVAPCDIRTGYDYASEISSAIGKSASLLLVFSTSSNSSDHCAREVELAQKNDLVIIPVKIDSSDASGGMEYRLSTVQWLDCNDKNLLPHLEATLQSAKDRQIEDRTVEYIILNTCVRCGVQFPEHDVSGCSYHASEPKNIGNAGPNRDYAEIWEFPCCRQKYVGTFKEITSGGQADVKPPVSPGCLQGKHISKYSYKRVW